MKKKKKSKPKTKAKAKKRKKAAKPKVYARGEVQLTDIDVYGFGSSLGNESRVGNGWPEFYT